MTPQTPRRSAIDFQLSQQAHRRAIGVLGFLLPFLLYGFAGLRPTGCLIPWHLLRSMSAYYYTGAVGVFVGVLFALSLFLLTYQGYQNDRADRVVGRIGCVAALTVVLFPTRAPKGVDPPTWWNQATGVLHVTGAVVLFASFAVFALWLFRLSEFPKRSDRPPDKRRRDDACLVCGILIVVGMLWAGVAGLLDAPIVIPEAIATMSFAVSWLVKGEAFTAAWGAAKRVIAR